MTSFNHYIATSDDDSDNSDDASKEAISAMINDAMKACDKVNVNDILLLKMVEYTTDLSDWMKF